MAWTAAVCTGSLRAAARAIDEIEIPADGLGRARRFVIPLNSRQFLPARAFWYLALRALLGAVLFVMFGRFAHFLAHSPVGRCSGVLCGNSNSDVIGWILYLFAGVMIVSAVLKFRWFSFILTDHTINIDSGVIVQSSRVFVLTRFRTWRRDETFCTCCWA